MIIKKIKPNISRLFVLILFFLPLSQKLIKAEGNHKQISVEYLTKKSNDFYILGSGDTIDILFQGLYTENDAYNNEENYKSIRQTIDINGKIFLPNLNSIYVKDLTIEELQLLLNKKYEEYLLSPEISISLFSTRPVSFTIKGEIDNPGRYVLKKNSTNNYEANLFDSIKKAGGLTIYADIKNIKIVRKNSISNGENTKVIDINLFDLLKNNLSINQLPIRDGDIIEIPKNEDALLENIKIAISSNLNPKFINVVMSGNINQTGVLKLSKLSSLNDAIAISGSKKIFSGKVNFVRLNSDGTIDRRRFRYSRKSKPGSFKNPYLSNGDIISIGNSAFNNFSTSVKIITDPITGIATSYSLYKSITD